MQDFKKLEIYSIQYLPKYKFIVSLLMYGFVDLDNKSPTLAAWFRLLRSGLQSRAFNTLGVRC